MIQTVDFFTPIVDDPYTFGQIAAANALSDVYAMGGEPKLALNIAAFPNCLDPEILGEIFRGGADKVLEAGATLAGGHTIQDEEPKYGLCVTGFVNPASMWKNVGARTGDILILTKPLGTGILSTAVKGEMASQEEAAYAASVMATLNKYARDQVADLKIHACTDVTGFSFLGHLHEMMDGAHSCRIEAGAVPVFSEALRHADEFLLTAAGQRNRNHTGPFVRFENVPFAMEEVLFDPQTSGGLLVALPKEQAAALVEDLRRGGAPAAVVGEVTDSEDIEIRVIG